MLANWKREIFVACPCLMLNWTSTIAPPPGPAGPWSTRESARPIDGAAGISATAAASAVVRLIEFNPMFEHPRGQWPRDCRRAAVPRMLRPGRLTSTLEWFGCEAGRGRRPLVVPAEAAQLRQGDQRRRKGEPEGEEAVGRDTHRGRGERDRGAVPHRRRQGDEQEARAAERSRAPGDDHARGEGDD